MKTTSPIDGKSLKMTSIDGARQIRPFRLVFALLHNSKTLRTSYPARQRERDRDREWETELESMSESDASGLLFAGDWN